MVRVSVHVFQLRARESITRTTTRTITIEGN
jgi:hypothetical protein